MTLLSGKFLVLWMQMILFELFITAILNIEKLTLSNYLTSIALFGLCSLYNVKKIEEMNGIFSKLFAFYILLYPLDNILEYAYYLYFGR